jgi:superfamily II RNA helicase
MGLNFNIRRVVFSTMKKAIGARGALKRGPVPPSLVKQIAGRAGRRNRCGGGGGCAACPSPGPPWSGP